MKDTDSKFISETLNYALNDCPVKDGDHETHFNTFANAVVVFETYMNNREYCSYCGYRLQHETYTDGNSPLTCRNSTCITQL